MRTQYESNITGILRSLVAHGARIDDRNEFGQTPAELATINGNYLAFEFLLDSGATSAKALLKKSASGDHVDATMLRLAIVMGKQEIFDGMLLDVDARLFDHHLPARVLDTTQVKAYQFAAAENTPYPKPGDLIYTANLGDRHVNAAFFVKMKFKATRLPPYRDYLLLESWPDFNREDANNLLASFIDED